jgi:hypothetical protein
MQTLIFTFMAFIGTIGNPAQPSSMSVSGESKIEVWFNKNTGFTELVQIKQYCEKNDIVLTYKKIQYNDQGLLVSLNFVVSTKDGRVRESADTDDLIGKKKFGFKKDISNSTTAFEIVE